eukprot:1414519-Amphidinium_carterae.1
MSAAARHSATQHERPAKVTILKCMAPFQVDESAILVIPQQPAQSQHICESNSLTKRIDFQSWLWVDEALTI